MSADISDEVYEAAVRAYFDDQAGSRDYLQILLERDMYEHRFRAALAVAYAAGQQSQPEPTRWQWGVRRDGQRSIQIREEQLARSRFRTAKLIGRELLRRPVTEGPWELVEYRKAGE